MSRELQARIDSVRAQEASVLAAEARARAAASWKGFVGRLDEGVEGHRQQDPKEEK